MTSSRMASAGRYGAWVMGGEFSEPAPTGVLEPDQPFEAVQTVAPVEVQERSEVLPEGTVQGPSLAGVPHLRLTVGALMFTVTLSDLGPLGPWQVVVKVDGLLLIAPLEIPPLLMLALEKPLVPVVEQDVALGEAHERVTDEPELTVQGPSDPLHLMLVLTTIGAMTVMKTLGDTRFT